ncbi:MAG: ABC transporter permease [Chloroflexota bacterium]|nr:ABC transporter permease [Chloroflexota bacterium]
MIFKNLFRRKGRTILTLLGIATGVATIIGLGAMAEGLQAGYTSMARGSQADLVLSPASAMDITMGSVEETVAEQVLAWPEVADVTGMLIGNVQAEGSPYFYIFGYDPQGFAIEHFKIVDGQTLGEARGVRGKPCLLGRAAAESFDKGVGDTLHITGGAFRIVGIYETGDGFEDGGGVISLREAQIILLQPRRASTFYIRLRDPEGEARLRTQVERYFPDLLLSTTSEFADRQLMIEMMEGFAWVISALAIAIGGVVMTNTLWMSVFERTREIGLLRAVGWRRGQVLRLILGESLALSLLGGLAGIGLGMVSVYLLGGSLGFFSVLGTHFSPALFARAIVTVTALGMVGGIYPARWASRLLPLEALRYEGGGESRSSRFLPGGMTVRNLWQRRTRTTLTALGIGVGIAVIVALGSLSAGFIDSFNSLAMGDDADLVAVEADVSDMGYSTINERVGARLSALPDVEAVAGLGFAFEMSEQNPLLFIMGYHPRRFAIRHFHVVEGEPLTTHRQVIVGRQAAEVMGVEVGDTLRILDSAFRVVGIYETGAAFEDSGVVVTLRDAQRLAGRPRQVSMYLVKLRDPERAEAVRANLNANFDEIDVSLTAEFAENLPDFQSMEMMVEQISFLAMFIGGLGMLNVMLMSVLERTQEIGVLRSLGWRRRQVIGMILTEALALGTVGGVCGILLGVGMAWGMTQLPGVLGEMIVPRYSVGVFAQALVVALATGGLGGIYPAWRATRMRPVEALRYE